MRLFFFVLSLGLFVVACTPYDQTYYRLHPKQLQQVLKQCAVQEPRGVNCDELKVLATQMTQLAYKLQKNPQAFGNQILLLQQEIAAAKLDPKANKQSIALLTKQLQDHLAIIKWLESPENY